MKKIIKKLITAFAACAMVLPVALLSGCDMFAAPDDSGTSGSGSSDASSKTYTVSYTVDETDYKLEVKENSRFELKDIPEKSGFAFVGLYDSADGGKRYTDEDGVSVEKFTDDKNIVLYARYLPKITFDENGGTDVEDIIQNADEKVELAGTTQKDCEFLGWYKDDGTEYKGGVMPEVGFTVTAKWKTQRTVLQTLTSGSKKVSSSKTGVIFTIDLSQYLEDNEVTEIAFSVSYDLKVNAYIPFGAPHWFDFKFYDRNIVNDAYRIGEAVCEWSGEYGNVSAKNFTYELTGNKVYVAADSNTWMPGYLISNFSVSMSFTDTF